MAKSPLLIKKHDMKQLVIPEDIFKEDTPLYSPKMKGDDELNTYTIQAMGE